jgi:uncharacterized protein (TIGR03086 family)
MGKSRGTRWEVLESAHRVLRSAVAGVDPNGWVRSSPCEEWNVTQVLQHAAGDQMAFASAITGGPGPSENPFSPSGVMQSDPLTFADVAIVAAAEAWATIGVGTGSVPTPLPQGALSPTIGVGACALDAAVHGWDIAMATGQRSALDASLARSLHEVAIEIVEPLRQYGAYAPALSEATDDDDVAALLRFLGRNPHWGR